MSGKQLSYVNQILLKSGSHIDKGENRFSDLNKNDVTRLLLSGKFGSINHKDLGFLMQKRAKQAK